ncbi:PilZ domain-containing protein [Campylobacter curvus]|uniref:PilZ domain-containing protein n=1 Tax=Campylobacter curvus (strain 525.92) TaxID=360105 RepID=A7H056_CAMC5|nr:PilZ domain-containing protein [Campylobacter curvus]EAU01109.1 hypothetical protein CCV52592_1697 [Campylobacter curvus 525.92]
MEFKGRQELATSCTEIISNFKSDFINDGVNFCKRANLDVSNEQLKVVLENIFDSLLLQDPNAQSLYKELENAVKGECERSDLLNFIFLNLILKFNDCHQNPAHLNYFIYAVERLIDILNHASPKDETSDVAIGQTNSFLFEDPINTFSRMKTAKAKPEFLNLYDGVNIKHEAQILDVQEDSVVFGVDIMQILAMKQEGNGFILPNEYFPKHLKSDISDFSIADKSVTLSNFSRISKMNANLRKFQRVHPNKFTKVLLKNDRAELHGNLYDISDGGLSVLSSESADFKDGEDIEAFFELVIPQTTPQNVHLKLRLITELAYKGYIRYCMQIIGESQIVQEFTSARVQETLDELRARISLYQ